MGMLMQCRRFLLNGIAFSIEAPSELSEYLEYYTLEPMDTVAQYHIVSTIRFVEEFDRTVYRTKISNDLYKGGEKSYYLFDQTLRISILELASHKIVSEIEILKKPLSCTTTLRNLLSSRRREQVMRARQHSIVQALRHAILYPYFIMLNQIESVALSHGSAFFQEGQSVAMIGFDGIGKSSLALLAQTEGATLLSDNFILYSKRSLFFVPDPLRLYTNGQGDAYGKKYEKIRVALQKVNTPRFIYTYLGERYYFKRGVANRLERYHQLFWDFLPEFLDLRRYLTFLALVNDQLDLNLLECEEGEDIVYYECMRATMSDNKRLYDDQRAV